MKVPVLALVCLLLVPGASAEDRVVRAVLQTIACHEKSGDCDDAAAGDLLDRSPSLREALELAGRIRVSAVRVEWMKPDHAVIEIDATGFRVDQANRGRRFPSRWHVIARDGQAREVRSPSAQVVAGLVDGTGTTILQSLSAALLHDVATDLSVLPECAQNGMRARCLVAGDVLRAEARRRGDDELLARAGALKALIEAGTAEANAEEIAEAIDAAERAGSASARAWAAAGAAAAEADAEARERWVRAAVAEIPRLEDPRIVLRALWQAAFRAYEVFDMASSFRFAEELHTHSQCTGWVRGEMLAMYARTRIAAALAEYEHALELADEARRGAELLRDRAWIARTLNMRAQLLFRSFRPIDPVPVLLEALEIAPPDASDVRSVVATNLAARLHERQRFDEASRYIELAVEEGLKSDSLYLATTYEILGAIRMAQGRIDEAVDAYHRGIEVNPESLWQIWATRTSLARALMDCGRLEQAAEELRVAVEMIEARRVLVPDEEAERARNFTAFARSYALLVSALVGVGRHEEALVVSENMRARVLSDVFATSEREMTLGHDERQRHRELVTRVMERSRAVSAADRQPHGPALEELRAARRELNAFEADLAAQNPHIARAMPVDASILNETWPAGEAGLAYVMSDAGVVALVRRTDDVVGVPLAVSYSDLRALMTQLLTGIEYRDLRWRRAAGALYDHLIRPVLPHLTGVRVLVIAPDAYLWQLPFHVLTNARGEALSDLFDIEYRPSLRVLKRPPRRGVEGGLLAMAHGDARPGMNLPALEEPLEEVRALRSIYAGDAAVFTGAAASEERFKSEAPEYRVIHVASHAVVEPETPFFSSILLAGSEGEDGMLAAREVARLRLNADVVVLSACETAGSDFGRGEGLIGMSWAFLAAGARATVVSRWKTESKSAAELSIAFHERLSAGETPAAALRHAQNVLRANPRYRDPLYWAGYMVIQTN